MYKYNVYTVNTIRYNNITGRNALKFFVVVDIAAEVM